MGEVSEGAREGEYPLGAGVSPRRGDRSWEGKDLPRAGPVGDVSLRPDRESVEEIVKVTGVAGVAWVIEECTAG